MNKFSLFFAFAAFMLLACSEDKPSPSHYELCTKPISKECLVGNWHLEKVEGGYSKCDPELDFNGLNGLKLEANGKFSFNGSYGGYNLLPKYGNWELDEEGTTMKINITDGYAVNAPQEIDATIDIQEKGDILRVSTSNYSSFLQCETGRVEVFSWQGK
jgi:hypothetical protein